MTGSTGDEAEDPREESAVAMLEEARVKGLLGTGGSCCWRKPAPLLPAAEDPVDDPAL